MKYDIFFYTYRLTFYAHWPAGCSNDSCCGSGSCRIHLTFGPLDPVLFFSSDRSHPGKKCVSGSSNLLFVQVFYSHFYIAGHYFIKWFNPFWTYSTYRWNNTTFFQQCPILRNTFLLKLDFGSD